MNRNSEISNAARDDRLDHWHGVVEQRLQILVGLASQYRKAIDGSKTQTKKKYFSKKFKDVSKEVLQLVGTMQSLEAQKRALQMPAEEVTVDTSFSAPTKYSVPTIQGAVDDAVIV
jgi:hypothetical protein